MASEISLTEQLQRFSGGDREIAEAVLAVVLPKLHEVATRQLGRERFHAPLTPTEFINEVWIRNLGQGGWPVRSREHFYAIAARAMRHVLVDFARSRLALSRGEGNIPVSLEETWEAGAPPTGTPEQVVELGLLMERLEQYDAAAARVVECVGSPGLVTSVKGNCWANANTVQNRIAETGTPQRSILNTA